jgi:hypothetical protein
MATVGGAGGAGAAGVEGVVPTLVGADPVGMVAVPPHPAAASTSARPAAASGRRRPVRRRFGVMDHPEWTGSSGCNDLVASGDAPSRGRVARRPRACAIGHLAVCCGLTGFRARKRMVLDRAAERTGTQHRPGVGRQPSNRGASGATFRGEFRCDRFVVSRPVGGVRSGRWPPCWPPPVSSPRARVNPIREGTRPVPPPPPAEEPGRRHRPSGPAHRRDRPCTRRIRALPLPARARRRTRDHPRCGRWPFPPPAR